MNEFVFSVLETTVAFWELSCSFLGKEGEEVVSVCIFLFVCSLWLFLCLCLRETKNKREEKERERECVSSFISVEVG